jgi:hypothetical protein
MKSYKITINVYNAGGVYSANDTEEAQKIAEKECNNIYSKLDGRCNVVLESIKEVDK